MYDHLSVDGLGIADEIPGPVFPVIGMPKLTTRMVARFQWSRIRGSSLAARQRPTFPVSPAGRPDGDPAG